MTQNEPYLTAESQDEQHEEEQHRPELRQRHHQHRLGVRDERQPRAVFHDLVDGHPRRVRHEAEDAEDGEPCVDRRQKVHDADKQGVSGNIKKV